MTTITPAEAAREVYNRRMARKHLLAFTQYTYPRYRADPFHAYIAGYMDRVISGEIKKLMLFAAPQHGKSELTSVRMPALWLAKHPDDPVIIASYGAHLAEDKSKQVRDVLRSPEYRALFPDIAIDRESRAVDHWKLAGHRGYVHATGVGGPASGFGAKLVIIDDPVKDYEEAASKTIQERNENWYYSTIYPRIWEGGAVILMLTRWHLLDLAGVLMDREPGAWTIVRIPAEAETQDIRDFRNAKLHLPAGLPDPLGRRPGQPAAPSLFTSAGLAEKKRSTRFWTALYQGFPVADEGNMFKRPWFTIVDAAPRDARRVRYWDKAGTSGGGARTAGVLLAVTNDQEIYVEDVRKGQWSIGQRERIIKQVAEIDTIRFGRQVDIWVEQEPGSAGKESAQNTVRNLAGFTARAETASGDKEVRAQPYASYAESFGVKLVRGDWIGEYLDELTSFPNGTFKDQVDASSGAFNKLVRGGGWSRDYSGKGGNGA